MTGVLEVFEYCYNDPLIIFFGQPILNPFETLLSSITPEIYERLLTAVELGKWQDGRVLEQHQTEELLQLTIAYSAKNKLNENQLFSVSSDGEIVDGSILKKTYLEDSLAKHDQIPLTIEDIIK